jgi:predicted porin
MRKTCMTGLLAGAASMGSMGIAHAQSSVTLYGVVDSGILYKTQAGAGGSAWQLAAGGESTNRWGITGSEDLGGGWGATFQLESGFRISNGTLINAGLPPSAGTFLFDRGATVGLTNTTFGALLFGENLSPLLRTLAQLDVTRYSNFGSLNNLLYQNLTGFNGGQYSWVDNSVEYQSPVVYGFRAMGMYAFGGVAGNFDAKRVISASLSWRFGDLLIAGAYFTGNDPTGATDDEVAKTYTIGANYQLDRFQFAFDFAKFENQMNGTDINFYTGEVAYQLSPEWSLNAVYIRLDNVANSDGNGNLYKAGASYALSKRTMLYADAAYVQNNKLGTLGIQNSVPIGVTGKNQLGLLAGMRHNF